MLRPSIRQKRETLRSQLRDCCDRSNVAPSSALACCCRSSDAIPPLLAWGLWRKHALMLRIHSQFWRQHGCRCLPAVVLQPTALDVRNAVNFLWRVRHGTSSRTCSARTCPGACNLKSLGDFPAVGPIGSTKADGTWDIICFRLTCFKCLS